MSDKDFNLLDEQWIRVIDRDCNIMEVSLIQLFRDAHIFKDLCGELPTQDFAVMRLLLAVLHTVFARYDINGGALQLSDPDGALDRWAELWENAKFPAEVITEYLESQRENFYLFHPERPFYQVAEMKELKKINNGEYDAQKLNGMLSKSGHKERLFSMVNGVEKYFLSKRQAIRWLINLNAFDDNALKAGAGIGWLGELGLIAVAGNNLFETLMLNFIVYNIYNDKIWKDEKPIWENKNKIPLDKRQIAFPDNPSEFFTLQSRRILLKRSGDRVEGYKILGGDFFDKESAFCEPMTLWKLSNKGNYYIPKPHDSSVQFWREFSSIVANTDHKKPGVIFWLKILNDAEIINKKYFISLKIAAIKYSGSQRSSIDDVFSDSLQMHASLLSEMSCEWQRAILDSVEFCDNISKKIWSLAKNVNLAEGGDFVPKENKCSAKVFANKSKSEFYNRIDAPFRKWLCMLDPEMDDAVEKEREWREKCVKIASELGAELAKQAGSAAILGKVKETKVYSVAEAMNKFQNELKAVKEL